MQAAAVELGANRYGKSRVRLMKVVGTGDHRDIYDWTVEVMLTGDFNAVYVNGDNSGLLTTDAIKNTVYAVARESAATTAEEFASELAGLLLRKHPALESALVAIEAALWKRLTSAGEPDPACFMHGSDEVATAAVTMTKGGETVVTAGLKNMVLLKTTRSAFSGFLRDDLTTLPDTEDRLLGTSMEARWTYVSKPGSFGEARGRIREALLMAFATHESKSVQHTLFAMGEAALRAAAAIDAIDLRMPNRHYLLVDLSRFGRDNPNQIFVATEEPHGTIEAQVRRTGHA